MKLSLKGRTMAKLDADTAAGWRESLCRTTAVVLHAPEYFVQHAGHIPTCVS